MLRFDGLYYALEEEEGYSYYFRFYEDGVVISVTSTGNSVQVARWFYRENPDRPFSLGQYRRVGQTGLEFSTACLEDDLSPPEPPLVVDYQAKIVERGLMVDSHSRRTGHRATRLHQFVALQRPSPNQST